MNQPRRARLRRLLLLVPLALLGAAWLARARLPRPQTEGDKWLWEQGETAFFVYVDFGPGIINEGVRLPKGVKGDELLHITDRQGIRTLFRALAGTAAFTPLKQGQSPTLTLVTLYIGQHKDGTGESVALFKKAGKYGLYREESNMVAVTTPKAAARLLQTTYSFIAKARHHETGFTLPEEGA